MKRSSATLPPEKSHVETKKSKAKDESLVIDTHDYLDLILNRITDLQRQINQGVYVTDNVINLGESEADGSIMKEVLTKVFKDIPETSKTVANIIDSTSKPSVAQLRAIRNKRYQLSGFEVCRKIATHFVKNIVCSSAFEAVPNSNQKRCDNTVEMRAKIAGQLDLHLAVKQRDYTARLMRE
ncbi:uncharacterized protein LOC131665992 isoform X2 [Phymastichus coffea]|uniref:uncharacterized protein LOC131665992 isoform X2 n=1 Tax=Phymastichus coffea TaxID=108790 RepID=UPI00273BEC02|nr:uncharacterized protein LOC131665992 isoform X2 [Phymastichus coffea]